MTWPSSSTSPGRIVTFRQLTTWTTVRCLTSIHFTCGKIPGMTTPMKGGLPPPVVTQILYRRDGSTAIGPPPIQRRPEGGAHYFRLVSLSHTSRRNTAKVCWYVVIDRSRTISQWRGTLRRSAYKKRSPRSLLSRICPKSSPTSQSLRFRSSPLACCPFQSKLVTVIAEPVGPCISNPAGVTLPPK